MDGWCAPDLIGTQWTPANAKHNKCNSWKIPCRIGRRKKQCNKNRPKQREPRIHPRGHEPQIYRQVQIPWICAKQQKQPRGPHQSNKSKSREYLPNATGHSREQELQQHRNANHMGANTELHNIDNSLQQWSPGKTENENINRIMDNILKRILMVPQSTPREALYIETGLLDPEAIRLKNRVLMEHRMMNGTSQTTKQKSGSRKE